MTELITEEKTKPETFFKSSCDRTSHIKAWRREPASQSDWYSESRKVRADLLRAKYLERSFRPSSAESYPRWAPGSLVFIPPINSLIHAIQGSRNIMELEDDWDEEGSPGYSQSTWNRAVKFLLANALILWRRHKVCFGAPRILPGPYGSIDLHWRTPKRELLINVPADAEEPASYYGDDREEGTENAIRGKKLDSSPDSEWIFLWLMK